MSSLLLWGGLTVLLALNVFFKSDVVTLLGSLLMIIGFVIMLLEYVKNPK